MPVKKREMGLLRVPCGVRRELARGPKFRFPLGSEMYCRWNGNVWVVELAIPGDESLRGSGSSLHWVVQRLGVRWVKRLRRS